MRGLIVLVLALCALPPPTRAAPEDDALERVSFSQKLNARIPPDLSFRDESGRAVRLGDYFGDKPMILALVYYECPMLCTETLNGLLRAIRSLSFTAGEEYRILTVSFDHRETPKLAAAKRKAYLERYGRDVPDKGWAFLTGDREPIRRLTETVGFRFSYDPKSGEYAHGTGLIVLTPQGKASHYFYGVEFPPKDLRLALMEASAGRIGTPVDQLLMYCYHYDPKTGRYGLAITRVLQLAGLLTLVSLATLVGLMLWYEKRNRKRTP